MISSCGQFVLSYNGKIDKAPELRTERGAAGQTSRGHSRIVVEDFCRLGPCSQRSSG